MFDDINNIPIEIPARVPPLIETYFQKLTNGTLKELPVSNNIEEKIEVFI